MSNCTVHLLVPSVAPCEQCQRSFCSACLVLVSGRRLCGKCGALSGGRAVPLASGPLGVEIGPPSVPTAAPTSRLDAKTVLSCLVALAAVALMFALSGRFNVVEAVKWAYVAWSLFWAAPSAWRWLQQRSRRSSLWPRAGGAALFGALIRAILMALATYLYSILGGGLYCFWRHRKQLGGTSG